MGVSSESSQGAEGKSGGAGAGQTTRCEPGDWVEIRRVLLGLDERAAGLPPETAATPLVMWVKGFAQGAAAVGEEVTVETMSGRVVGGELFAVNPGYFHTFGAPVAELTHVGRDLRSRVAAYRAGEDGARNGEAGLAGAADAGGAS
jgi:2-amino-4-ketopentanoate thiolase alpha subunit